MGDIRVRKKAEKDFNRAFQMHDIRAALQLISKWVGKPIEEEEVVRYDSRTGEPKATGRWKAGEVWKGVVWLGGLTGSMPGINPKDPLYAPLRKAIKSGETVLVAGYVVQHVPKRSEGGLWLGGMADQGGTWPAHFLITKPRVLP